MGLWPGEAHFAKPLRLQRPSTSTILRELLGDRHARTSRASTSRWTDCKLSPAAAGRREDRLRRPEPARHRVRRRPTATTTSPLGKGVNTPTAHRADQRALMAEAAAKTGRDVGNYVLMMVIADETDEAAMAKWKHYNDGADHRARWPGWPTRPTPTPTRPTASTARRIAAPEGAVNFNMGTLVGSYATVARMLDEVRHRARHQGHHADLRRLPDRHGAVRPAHPAADAEPPRRKLAAVA